MLLKSNNSQNSSNAFEKLRALEDILRSRGLSYTFLEPPSEVDKNTNLLVQCDNCLMSFSKLYCTLMRSNYKVCQECKKLKKAKQHSEENYLKYVSNISEIYKDRPTLHITVHKPFTKLISASATVICSTHKEERTVLVTSLLANSVNCSICTNFKIWKESCYSVHKDKYYLEDVVYINKATEVEIPCKVHGFFKIMPFVFKSGKGCDLCEKEQQRLKSCLNSQRKLDLKFTRNTYKIIKESYQSPRKICKIFCNMCQQETEQRFDCFYNSNGCFCIKGDITKRNRSDAQKTQETWEECYLKIPNNWKNFFQISLASEFESRKSLVTLVCKKHPAIILKPKIINHLLFHDPVYGCKECFKEISGWSRTSFIKRCKDKQATFYILRCFNENEEFYKLGITSNSIQKRYFRSSLMPYQFEIVQELKGDPDFIFDLEWALKKYIKKINVLYTPFIYFDGSKSETYKFL